MADPLSPATRATKRNLLIASVLAISANAFNVSIDKIPLAGLSVNFDDRLFAFLLVLSLIYFLCTFVLYYFIDIKNLEPTEHQKAAQQRYHDQLAHFPDSFRDLVRRDLNNRAPDNYSVQTAVHFDGDGSVKGKGTFTLRKTDPTKPHAAVNAPRQQETEAAYAALEPRLDFWKRRYPMAFRSNRLRASIRLSSIQATYAVRNYFFDGAMPILLGLFALAAILGRIDLHWIQHFLPSFKVLSQ